MRPPSTLLLILVIAASQAGFCADAPATVPAVPPVVAAKAEPAQRLSAAARRLLASVKTSAYSHRTSIDEDSGIFVTDCSGLLTWLLRQELPTHLAAIPVKRGHSRPLAVDFQQAFASKVPGWRLIVRVQDAHPGDVLAWSHPDPQPGKSTGHVMIIDGDAIPDGEGLYAMAVIDSTSAPHDDDTRSDTDGVGRGMIHLRVDADGALVAVKGEAKAAFRKHVFSIARPVDR